MAMKKVESDSVKKNTKLSLSPLTSEALIVRLITVSGFKVEDLSIMENEDGSESWTVVLKK